MRFRSTLVFLVLIALLLPAAVQAQSSLDQFHHDLISYFANRTWIGNARLFMTNYSDTVRVTIDSSGQGLVIHRTLVDEDEGVAISKARGSIVPVPGEDAYRVHWSEHRYPAVTGRMDWQDGRWSVTFAGEWKNWFIYLAQVDANAFSAAVARALGNFSPVEIARIRYVAASGAKPSGGTR